jgi:hypothetical protein
VVVLAYLVKTLPQLLAVLAVTDYLHQSMARPHSVEAVEAVEARARLVLAVPVAVALAEFFLLMALPEQQTQAAVAAAFAADKIKGPPVEAE